MGFIKIIKIKMASLSRFFSRTSGVYKLLPKQQFVRTYADAAPAAKSPVGMNFTFACPSEAFYNSSADVSQVDIPTGSGAIGVLANHVPTLGVLAPGVLTVFEKAGESKKFFVSSGTYSVNEDSSVIVTAEEAVPLDYLDKEVAKANLSKSQSELASATTDVAKAEAQIAVECNQAIVNA